jgi:hypothetical protein
MKGAALLARWPEIEVEDFGRALEMSRDAIGIFAQAIVEG